MVRDTNPKKMKNGQKGAWPRSRDLLFKFWDPSNISGIAEDTNLKICMHIDGKVYYTKKWKMGQKGAWPRPRELLFKFWDPPNISGTVEGTKLKFSRQIARKGY